MTACLILEPLSQVCGHGCGVGLEYPVVTTV